MDNKKYREIIKKGERVEWYGIEVPKDLITNLVSVWSSNLKSEIDKLESELNDLGGVSLERRKAYIKGLTYNLHNAPYTLNGDVYLKKKKEIELEIEDKNKKNKKKVVKKSRSKTTINKKSSPKTKNSELIFGKTK
tara:strand:+ start:622 stop:1029 length:408 start_codon:yes stop_codon:yes gene_type:complete